MLTVCREYRRQIIELARGEVEAEQRALLMRHVDGCAGCARLLDRQVLLSAAFDSLKVDPLPERGAIEARVMAEFDRTTARRVSRWLLVAGIAAAVCLGVVLLQRRPTVVRQEASVVASTAPAILRSPEAVVPQASTLKQVRHNAARRRADEENQPFVQIPYTVPLGPEERTTVVRMEITVAALIAAGFSVPVSDPGATVLVDVLVSEDGRARAIRPVKLMAGGK